MWPCVDLTGWSGYGVRFLSVILNCAVSFYNYVASMLDERMTWALVTRNCQGKTEVLCGEKSTPAPISPPQIAHWLVWDWTRSSAVRCRGQSSSSGGYTSTRLHGVTFQKAVIFIALSFTSVCKKAFVSNKNDKRSHPDHVMCHGELGRLGTHSCCNDFTGYLTCNVSIYAGSCSWYSCTDLRMCWR